MIRREAVMTAPGRRSSTFTWLLRHGFIHASDAERLLDSPVARPRLGYTNWTPGFPAWM
ncbi:hypothetical protein [Streptomyces sp. NPDC001275]